MVPPSPTFHLQTLFRTGSHHYSTIGQPHYQQPISPTSPHFSTPTSPTSPHYLTAKSPTSPHYPMPTSPTSLHYQYPTWGSSAASPDLLTSSIPSPPPYSIPPSPYAVPSDTLSHQHSRDVAIQSPTPPGPTGSPPTGGPGSPLLQSPVGLRETYATVYSPKDENIYEEVYGAR